MSYGATISLSGAPRSSLPSFVWNIDKVLPIGIIPLKLCAEVEYLTRCRPPPFFFACGVSRCDAIELVFRRLDRSRQSKRLLGWLPLKGSFAPNPFSPHDKSRKKRCVADWLPEHRGLRGCPQFTEPRARCSSGGRADYVSSLWVLLGPHFLSPRGPR